MGSTLSNILLHIVFSTKLRQPHITTEIRERLYQYIGGVIRGERCSLIEIGGVEDHVHLLIRLHPDVATSTLMRKVKGGSSLWVHETFPGLPFKWQDGYAPFSVSQSALGEVQAYIRNQAEHHRAMSFQDELRAILRKNNIEFDEAHLWD